MRVRIISLLAALVAVSAVVWMVADGDKDPGVEGSEAAAALGVPSVLLQDPTDPAEIPESAEPMIGELSIRGISGDVTVRFDDLHRVDGPNDTTVVVALDSSRRLVCLSVQVNPNSATASSCFVMATIATRGSLTSISVGGPDGNATVGIVTDDVIEVLVDQQPALLVDNVYFATSTETDLSTAPVTVRYQDGSTTTSGQLGLLPVPAGAAAQASLGLRRFREPSWVGCARFDDGFAAITAFVTNDEFISIRVDESAIQVSSRPHGIATIPAVTEHRIIGPAIIQATDHHNSFAINATWATLESTGTVHIDCGPNYIDARKS